MQEHLSMQPASQPATSARMHSKDEGRHSLIQFEIQCN
jgi:hypothetical protein